MKGDALLRGSWPTLRCWRIRLGAALLLLGGCDPTTSNYVNPVANPPVAGDSSAGDATEPGGSTVLSAPLVRPDGDPSDLAAVRPSADTVLLTWTDNSSNEDGFTIQRYDVASGWVDHATVAGGVVQFVETGIGADSAYLYRIVAFNAAGTSGFSNEASAPLPEPASIDDGAGTEEPPAVPMAPSDPTAVLTPARQIKLTWTDNSLNETGFTIRRKVNAGSWVDYASVGADVTQFVDETVTAGNEYCYSVAAFNPDGESEAAGQPCCQVPSVPPAGGGGSGGGGAPPPAPSPVRITGQVLADGHGIPNTTVSAGVGGYSAVTDADGVYVIEVPSGWSGSIAPVSAGYEFDPPSRALVNVTADISNQDFAGGALRTAQTADSWLVLYNVNEPDSVAWAQWYAQQRGIPSEQLLGLNASSDEHLPDQAAAETQVFAPVNAFLAANPLVAGRIMGIVAGYRVPGHYGIVPYGVGGESIACALQHPASIGQAVNPDSPHRLGTILPPAGRLTKAAMTAGHYMVARIDAPTLDGAKALTLRAKAIWAAGRVMPGNYIYFDYSDDALLDDTWPQLQSTFENPLFADLPWRQYDEDTEQTPADAFRFGTHDVANWNNTRLRSPTAGPRILAYDMNSWGATTVRSTTAEGGRFVPNAIDAGYAAAVGSTGEPNTALGPYPDTLLAALRSGWTLGEAFYLANSYDSFMWEVVGDPFLRVPDWSSSGEP